MDSTNPIVNALTIDLEDYFQVHAFSNAIRFEDWDNYDSRIERNTHRLLDILHEYRSNCLSNVLNSLPQSSVNSMDPTGPSNATNPRNPRYPTAAQQNCSTAARCSPKATFFCLGWLAERYPRLIQEIQSHGHEIACHGYAHKLIYAQTKEEFRNDIRKAKAILEDITGIEVLGYRAPSYSITNQSQWAFEVLMEEGFGYDSSVFPIHHDFYGFPQAPRFPFTISLNGNSDLEFQMLNFELEITPNSELRTRNCLLEFPISTVCFCGQNLPISGGGYFRLFPYPLIRRGLKAINEKEGHPFVFYIHPWELDPGQPRIGSVSRKSRFRHYVNLRKTELRFKRLLSDFDFCSIKEVLELNGHDKLKQHK